MKRFYRSLLLMVLFTSAFNKIHAQNNVTAPLKIAVFVPLYLDEAFTGYTYQLDKNNLPQNILAGLEFYNGVMLAADSLAEEGANIQINIYDTKQPTATLTRLLNSSEMLNTGLMIASFTTAGEVKLFADQALKNNIPLISATYPNVGGIVSNPFFVLLNSSFQTHVNGIFKYLQKNEATSNIIAFRRSGAIGDYIKNRLTELNTSSKTAKLKFKWVDLPDKFTQRDVVKHLDSTINNIILVASPMEKYGLDIVKTLNNLEQYRSTAVGMPTWDGVKELNGKDCRNVEIVYSTPFVFSRFDHFESNVVKRYKAKYYSRPSDMVFRGFETTFHFGKLLLQYKGNLINNLSSEQFKLFNDFDIQPVKLRESSVMPDYLENKKLYFLRKQEGNIKSVS